MRRRPLLFLAAIGCFGVAGLTPVIGSAQADVTPGSGFYGYTLTANANGLQGTEDEPSANSHPEGEGEVPHSQISLTSGPVGYALASISWPGALAGNAGSLILLVKPDAPPQVKMLNDPVRAEARTGEGASDVVNDDVPGAHMAATATPGRVAANALVNGGAAGTTYGFGRTSAATTAVLGVATADTTADSEAKDITLAAGAVHIGSVVSHAEGHTNGVTASGKGKTTVNEMTIGGVPVVVDDQGVTVDTAHQGVDPVAGATLNSVLANLGMSVVLSQPTVTRNGGSISYDAGSLIVNWRPPNSVNIFTAHLGGARVLAAATPATFASAPLPVGEPVVVPPVSSVEPPAVVPPYGAPVTGVTVPIGTAPVVPPVVPQQPPVVAASQERLLDGLGIPVWSVLLTATGALFLVAGLWRVPVVVLPDEPPVRCPLEEN
jgi:hypothetical protein